MMQQSLADRVAVVTGASRGIGRAIAQALAASRMRLVLVARTADALRELADSVDTECVVHAADLRRPQVAAAVVDAALSRFGRIDLLVNNAGATRRGDFMRLADPDWEDGFSLKFFGAMRLCRAAWPQLVRTGGAIVNIAGVGGRTASADFTIGGSVNAAVLNLTKALAHRGVADGVRVNAINPGSIATDRLRSRIATLAEDRGLDYDAASSDMAGRLGVARFGTPEEIAQAVLFLCSPMSSYCQGVILDVDGGQTRTL